MDKSFVNELKGLSGLAKQLKSTTDNTMINSLLGQ